MLTRSVISWKMPNRLRLAPLVLTSLFAGVVALPVNAQTVKKKPSSVSGSPLDTILSTRLWTTPPPMKDFVRETRPDPSTLDYTPLVGKDPERPKLRDNANIKALQAELEQGIQSNEKRAKPLGGITKPAAPDRAQTRKSKSKTSSASTQ